MKFNFVSGLEKTSKVVGLLASISFGISVIAACTRFTKSDIKILLGIARTKKELKEPTSEPEQPKPQPKKTSSSKKPSASKEASVEEPLTAESK